MQGPNRRSRTSCSLAPKRSPTKNTPRSAITPSCPSPRRRRRLAGRALIRHLFAPCVFRPGAALLCIPRCAAGAFRPQQDHFRTGRSLAPISAVTATIRPAPTTGLRNLSTEDRAVPKQRTRPCWGSTLRLRAAFPPARDTGFATLPAPSFRLRDVSGPYCRLSPWGGRRSTTPLSRRTRVRRGAELAPSHGFEPQFPEPKSGVLPLDDEGSPSVAVGWSGWPDSNRRPPASKAGGNDQTSPHPDRCWVAVDLG